MNKIQYVKFMLSSTIRAVYNIDLICLQRNKCEGFISSKVGSYAFPIKFNVLSWLVQYMQTLLSSKIEVHHRALITKYFPAVIT